MTHMYTIYIYWYPNYPTLYCLHVILGQTWISTNPKNSFTHLSRMPNSPTAVASNPSNFSVRLEALIKARRIHLHSPTS